MGKYKFWWYGHFKVPGQVKFLLIITLIKRIKFSIKTGWELSFQSRQILLWRTGSSLSNHDRFGQCREWWLLVGSNFLSNLTGWKYKTKTLPLLKNITHGERSGFFILTLVSTVFKIKRIPASGEQEWLLLVIIQVIHFANIIINIDFSDSFKIDIAFIMLPLQWQKLHLGL